MADTFVPKAAVDDAEVARFRRAKYRTAVATAVNMAGIAVQ